MTVAAGETEWMECMWMISGINQHITCQNMYNLQNMMMMMMIKDWFGH